MALRAAGGPTIWSFYSQDARSYYVGGLLVPLGPDIHQVKSFMLQLPVTSTHFCDGRIGEMAP